MTKIEDIEKAVTALAPKDLARFRVWFAEFDAERFDQQIERDAGLGKLDGLAEEALQDLKSGKTRDL